MRAHALGDAIFSFWWPVPAAIARGRVGPVVAVPRALAVHYVTKGLDIPISGEPAQRIDEAVQVSRVALVIEDYPVLQPKLEVSEGDEVRDGDPLLSDRRTPGVRYASPGTGRVVSINRGERRALKSVVVELDEREPRSFDLAPGVRENPARLRELLVRTGLWTALRARPFTRVPSPSESPHSLFVTAMDTEPLSPDADVVLEQRRDDFAVGVVAVAKLCRGTTYLCTSGTTEVSVDDENVQSHEFVGAHPAGSVGMHIHMLDPVHRNKTVWHIGYQDVIAIGHLLRTGRLEQSRVISLAGPGVKRPRLIRTRVGAAVDELCAGELKEGEMRVISGSVLSGRKASEHEAYLGRYHQQLSALCEGRQRKLLAWLLPGFSRFSVLPAFAGFLRKLGLRRGRGFTFTTTTNGGRRAMVPVGTYERVMPMDIMVTHLLRALCVGDAEWAEELGALELDEEDLALCSFVCPGKMDYGLHLRRVLQALQEEGAA